MSLVTLSEVRALVETGLTDVDLQAVLDREEGWLAGKVGVLTGERTDTFWPVLTDTPIYLSRRAAAVVVTDNALSVAPADLRFVPESGMVRRTSQYWTGGPIAVTWTPADLDTVKRGVIELVRGTVGETGFDSETLGEYSYTRGDVTLQLSRLAIVRSVLLRRPAYSTRVRASLEPA